LEEKWNFKVDPIGVIETPYYGRAPYQPVDDADEEFCIVLDEKYTDGLRELEKFKYIYVLYYAHLISRELRMVISPPWTVAGKVGIFASRSPVRPNPIGLSVVKIREIIDNRIYTSGMDVFDGTPVLDIKPYIKDLDSKNDANSGWIDELDDSEHLALHIKGIPHDY